ncbi:type IV toxin-antitoxin system AbiEi family antitoxin domain-containing protein [Noviherbaspirillum denitrificans]|uniref:type IV toxin-antitoxin system AbiEi family antitoxin domain-containing protein n=1 Tax=Noviherbaspirillum denitrificans TaxID=1968433 RepID=UPI001F19CD79|nr:transcriptional regulator [Noviherbaspirillum denitrificans]
MSEHEELLKVAVQMRKGVFCLFSALRFFHIETHLERGIWLAVPPQYKPPKITPSKLYYARLSGAAFSSGIETHVVNGLQIRVYGVAKTVADCFRFHRRIGFQVALNALRQAWISNRLDIEELLHYAKILQVEEVLHPYLASLIWHKRTESP